MSGLSGLRPARLGLMLLAVALLALNGAPAAFAAGGHINQITIAGSINAGSADYIVESIQLSEEDGARALLIELDTPGGFVNASLDIVKSILNAKVPIIVWVTPRGAWAASAGTFITVAANIAAMSPGSSIGAAHPVGLTGGGQKGEDGEPAQEDVSLQKMENILAATMEGVAQQRERNVEWVVDAVRNSITATAEEALELGVIDLVVDDRDELLAAIDGREVKVDGDPVTLDVADASVRVLDMTIRQKVFNFLASPDVLIILLVAGALGLYLEFNNPGMIVPGLIGLVCMVLVGFGLQILPFSWIGLTLILAGLALMVAEIFFASFGVLFALGIACFFIGGTMVFDTPELSNLTVSVWSVLLPAVIGLGAFGGLVVFTVGRSLLLEQSAGVDEMRGLIGEATTSLSASNEGKVFVRGEYWNAIGEDGLEPGERIEVVGVEGMKLRVRRAGGTR